MYGVRTEETMADRALINRYDYDAIFGTGEWFYGSVVLKLRAHQPLRLRSHLWHGCELLNGSVQCWRC